MCHNDQKYSKSNKEFETNQKRNSSPVFQTGLTSHADKHDCSTSNCSTLLLNVWLENHHPVRRPIVVFVWFYDLHWNNLHIWNSGSHYGFMNLFSVFNSSQQCVMEIRRFIVFDSFLCNLNAKFGFYNRQSFDHFCIEMSRIWSKLWEYQDVCQGF